ncbi:CDP-alcohol phosphatidyltransferase family protein [Bradyrhizobium sp. NBAIM01]|uniref:CDP-alcohol phosphatidyltransferase family protein n=1 Tax=Bradyrhizobium sp. NBAIM01 TaxID=2793818 RepID=UPI001CD5F012|nr:CDP-alcohol phosphatidyltransferase family protein [Bradyrhizobium sp. NBAIM01]MCA1510331.1 CDP-alcohol phosphatidyltransferase family protein [Bradyrhizobium sp. NBAIM01]
MLKYLWDPANAITTGGLILSSVSLFLAVSNRLELSLATALWAVLSDHLDGVVAARTKHRRPDFAKMGKSLDGFADMIYGAVLPAVILIQLSGASVFALVTATSLLAAGAVRLSYFDNFGHLRDGSFLGLPLSYDIPVMAIIFLARPLVPVDLFASFTLSTFILLAGLHVASIRVAAPNVTMYVAISIFVVIASSTLGLRGLS